MLGQELRRLGETGKEAGERTGAPQGSIIRITALRSGIRGCYAYLPSRNPVCGFCRSCDDFGYNRGNREAVSRHLGPRSKGATAYSSTNPLRLADANVPRSPRILEKIDERWRTEETKG